MKKNKGFTLIELLAIIVILAIIAVITVPIILNVIENSRKGAAIDSAYGYKDAVIKYYVSEMIDKQDLNLDNIYTIDETGKLLGETESEPHTIPISGTQPSGGYLIVTNSTINDGCLTIGDYQVTLENGNATAEKGKCESLSLTACDSPLFDPSPKEWFQFYNDWIVGFSNEYDGTKNITFPCTTIDDVKVTTIAQSVFQNRQFENIIINDNIKTISSNAFHGSLIENVIIGSGVTTIASGAFASCQLTSIEIPNSVTEIGVGAFSNNQLTTVTIPKNVTIIGSSAFTYNSGLNAITVKGKSEIPDTWDKNWNADGSGGYYKVEWK